MPFQFALHRRDGALVCMIPAVAWNRPAHVRYRRARMRNRCARGRFGGARVWKHLTHVRNRRARMQNQRARGRFGGAWVWKRLTHARKNRDCMHNQRARHCICHTLMSAGGESTLARRDMR
ncbi:MAG: hypothetical protein ACKV2V_08055 [Blastocatellia bacterium]